MEGLLESALGLSFAKASGQPAGGCINLGQCYDTDRGKIYVKMNSKRGARLMFDGELAGLEAIRATATVRAPEPLKVLPQLTTEGALLVMEYLDMRGAGSHGARLGEQLARMHLHNEGLAGREESEAGRLGAARGGGERAECVAQFGFPVPTSCGFIPQENDWCDDWVAFYARHRLKAQLDLIQRDYGDREVSELWPLLERALPGLFEGLEIRPALLHGDLWGGNAAETASEPVVFDPASFYGHSEYELAIAGMFGGFGRGFYDAYHKLIPKAPGFARRHEVYKLFHYLNHWNHFGSGYRGSSVSIMRSLTR